MRLGVCYYPEHWPESRWADDARRMVAMGLTRVRIGEFAWSRIEPEPGRFDWGWLDRAVDTLHRAGLGIIMGTPTATPPKWLVDAMPDMVAVDAEGRPRGFGSRRHYCFSHQGYAGEAARIVAAVAERYGEHPAVVAWQTDNEYGCHDTVVSYSDAARAGFRQWLAQRYADVAQLNAAWGNVFWSMEYRAFDAVDLPNLSVTEANPAHWLDFRRYSSEQVVRFNAAQVSILRQASPGRDIIHNFMGFFTEFDHHAVGRDLDSVGWDSYPLGFLEQFWFSDAEKRAYLRQGHPDIAAFHHDLYRGCARDGRWSVLEQQPGPVNWARFNPAPLPGMVRLWTLEAMAHGAEMVSYFRWRQFPKAQEQMHAGLLRPDSVDDIGALEVAQAARDIAAIGPLGSPPKSVALVFSYESAWVTDIQPQGSGFSALRLAFEFYSGLRTLGLDIDIVPPGASLDGYAMAVIPCLPIVPDALVHQLAGFAGPIVIGPRTGSKTGDFAIPDGLPPGNLQALMPLKVVRVESLRDGVEMQGDGFAVARWFEHAEGDAAIEEALNDGRGIVFKHGAVRYFAGWPDHRLRRRVFERAAREAGISTVMLSEGVRLRSAGTARFAFNYSAEPVDLTGLRLGPPAIGELRLQPADMAMWRLN
jgi:beta-galactosidase